MKIGEMIRGAKPPRAVPAWNRLESSGLGVPPPAVRIRGKKAARVALMASRHSHSSARAKAKIKRARIWLDGRVNPTSP